MLSSIKKAIRPRARLRDIQFNALFRKYQDATMIPRMPFTANLRIAHHALQNQPPDMAIVECGTWRGGMSAALIEIGGPNRDYHFFDSFEGLPPASEKDGQRAMQWSKETEPDVFNNNCSASLEEFEQVIARANPNYERTHIHKGWFENTVPKLKVPIRVLRLDGDWYESTMVCLDNLWDCVVENGVVLLDDYSYWEGCRRAVHDFLSRRNIPVAIQRDGDLAFLIKP